MLVLISILLALIPTIAILYPFLRGPAWRSPPIDENSTDTDLTQKWEVAIAGLKNTELEWNIGNLNDQDYRWLKHQYMMDASSVMKAMEIEKTQEQEILSSVNEKIRVAKKQLLDNSVREENNPSDDHNEPE